MKLLKLATLSIVAAASLQSLISCTSDANPFDVLPTKVETPFASIRLNFNVAATRAEDQFSTDDEKKVSKVCVYIFNDAGILERFEDLQTLTDDAISVSNLTPGEKTIYAVSAKKLNGLSVTAVEGSTTLASFEDAVFSSKLADITLTHEFVMVSKPVTHMVYRTASEDAIPASNIFNIELVRLVAKTQVRLGDLKLEEFGFKMNGIASFNVSQTCDQMRIKPNGNNIMACTDKSAATFPGYTIDPGKDNQDALTGSFTKDNCHYLSENIVDNPMAGNTSFIVLSMPLIPINTYSYDKYTGNLTYAAANAYTSTFFAVAIVDRSTGLQDFAIDPSNKHVMTFTNQTQATDYAKALNGGEMSAMTVSEYESPMKIVDTRAEARQFEVIYFNDQVKYRINIGEGDDLKVERNKFYKITVNSIKSLGCNSEDLLRPTDPTVDPTASPTTAMVNAMFKVAEWNEVDKGVDL